MDWNGGYVSATYSAIKMSSPGSVFTGTGNFNTSPLFLDSTNYDLGIEPGSPCANAGDPYAGWDANGTRLDIGAVPVDQSIIGGTVISASWGTEYSPYHVTSAVTVPDTSTLTINAGVQVLFDADVKFTVAGGFNALGTESDSIWFRPGTAAEWGGLRFTGNDSARLFFTSISGGAASGSGEDPYGGGVYAGGTAQLGMYNCTVRDNAADQSGGGVCFRQDASGTLADCDIHRNVANGSVFRGGGGVANAGYGTYVVTLTNCDIHHNEALTDGGGFAQTYAYSGTVYLNDCRIWANTAGNQGGGVHGDQGYTTYMTRCLVYGNYAEVAGGGICARQSGTSTHLYNCTVYENSVGVEGLGPEIYVYDDFLEVRNSIVWNSEGRGRHRPELWVRGRHVQQREDGYAGRGSTPGQATSVLSPEFVDSTAFNLAIQTSSPCVNAGDPDGARLERNARPTLGRSPSTSPSSRVPSRTRPGPPTTAPITSSASARCWWAIRSGSSRASMCSSTPTCRSSSNGWLNTWGTEADSVRFLPGTAGTWRGLRFINISPSEFHYTRVSGSHAVSATNFNGGAIYFYNGGLELDHCVISDNTADYAGGGICVDQAGSALDMEYCSIVNNSATWDGGGLYAGNGATVTLDHCLIAGNHVRDGGRRRSRHPSRRR